MSADHVAIVGMPATGKSAVCDLVAADLGVASAHLDEIVESAAAMPVEEIFATQGETRFREIESACLFELLDAEEPTVIACGGGVPTVDSNVSRLRGGDVHVVWLTALPATLRERLADDVQRRPLLADMTDVDRLYRERRHLYWRVADVVVPTDRRAPTTVATVVRGRLVASGFSVGE
ncbi:MAG: shikimate kinase [Acidimicrobiia bacterium]|nr:shikimate kinase [Acidimicrobiia bacterium]